MLMSRCLEPWAPSRVDSKPPLSRLPSTWTTSRLAKRKFGEPIYRYDARVENDVLYTFIYWAGPEASEEHEQEMLDVIRSLRFDIDNG